MFSRSLPRPLFHHGVFPPSPVFIGQLFLYDFVRASWSASAAWSTSCSLWYSQGNLLILLSNSLVNDVQFVFVGFLLGPLLILLTSTITPKVICLWSDSNGASDTLQFTSLPMGACDLRVISITSSPLEIYNVCSLPLLVFFSSIPARYFRSASPLLFMPDLPHTVWSELASLPIIFSFLLALQSSMSSAMSSEGGGVQSPISCMLKLRQPPSLVLAPRPLALQPRGLTGWTHLTLSPWNPLGPRSVNKWTFV